MMSSKEFEFLQSIIDEKSVNYSFIEYVKIKEKSSELNKLLLSSPDPYNGFIDVYYSLGDELSKNFPYSVLKEYYNIIYINLSKNYREKLEDSLYNKVINTINSKIFLSSFIHSQKKLYVSDIYSIIFSDEIEKIIHFKEKKLFYEKDYNDFLKSKENLYTLSNFIRIILFKYIKFKLNNIEYSLSIIGNHKK